MRLMEVTTMTICASVSVVTRSLPVRRWKEGNECKCGTVKTRNAGCASTMSGISVWVVVAGFALAVAVAFVGQSFERVRLVFWYGATSVEYKRWLVVLSVGLFG